LQALNIGAAGEEGRDDSDSHRLAAREATSDGAGRVVKVSDGGQNAVARLVAYQRAFVQDARDGGNANACSLGHVPDRHSRHGPLLSAMITGLQRQAVWNRFQLVKLYKIGTGLSITQQRVRYNFCHFLAYNEMERASFARPKR